MARSDWSRRAFRTLLLVGAAGLLAEPAFAGPPFRTDDPEPVEYQHFELDLFSQGTKTEGGWSGVLPGFEVNYGALPNLQLHAVLPQGFNAPDGGRTGFALGDIELGVKYRFITPGEDDWFPQVAVFPLIEVPAGTRSLVSARATSRPFSQSGCKRSLIPGPSTAAAAIGSIRVMATRTMDFSASRCGGK
jgi:hypothetical protein